MNWHKIELLYRYISLIFWGTRGVGGWVMRVQIWELSHSPWSRPIWAKPISSTAWKWVGEPDCIALHCTEQQQCNALWVICIEMFCTLHYLAIAQCTLHRITMFCIIHIVHILHIVHCTVHTHTGSLGNAMTWNAVLIHPPESQLTHPSSFFARFTLEDC